MMCTQFMCTCIFPVHVLLHIYAFIGKVTVLIAVGKVGDHVQDEICSRMEVQVNDSMEEQSK